MRFSEFDFDVITTPADEVTPPPKRSEADPAPERPRREGKTGEPPDDETPR